MEDEKGEVITDEDGRRFVYRENGVEAELRFRLNGKRLVLVHTEVPPSLSGGGVGGLLVRAAVEHARANGETIVPWCPFAQRWLRDHADDVADLSIDWPEPSSRGVT